jgi:hypothetical protein
VGAFDNPWLYMRLERDRLLAAANNPDEPIVPVVYSPDQTQSGYYRVLSASADMDLALSISSNTEPRVRWSAELERVRNALQEVVSIGAVRTNAHSITDGRAFMPMPDAAKGFGPAVTGWGSNVTYGYDSFSNRKYDNGTGTDLYDTRNYWTLDPAAYYHGACRYITTGGESRPLSASAAMLAYSRSTSSRRADGKVGRRAFMLHAIVGRRIGWALSGRTGRGFSSAAS